MKSFLKPWLYFLERVWVRASVGASYDMAKLAYGNSYEVRGVVLCGGEVYAAGNIQYEVDGEMEILVTYQVSSLNHDVY